MRGGQTVVENQTLLGCRSGVSDCYHGAHGPSIDRGHQFRGYYLPVRHRFIDFCLLWLRAGLLDAISRNAVVPYYYRPNFSVSKIDPYAVIMLVALSSATSWISSVRHRIEAALRSANREPHEALRR